MTTQDPNERQANRRSSERRHADRALRACEDRYRALFDSVDCVCVFDFKGRFLDANPAALRLLGYEREELLAQSLSSLLDDDQLARAFGVLAELREAGSQKTPTEFRLTRKDGGYAQVETKASFVFRDGKPYAVLGVGCDITERRQAEQARRDLEGRLQQSQRLESLGVLAGGIAHDFNNILMSVLGNAELALSEISAAAPARDRLLEITQAARRAADLCRQMLAYSGRGHLFAEAIDLHALIEDMLGLLHSTVSKKALLKLNLGTNLPPMRGDASQISQVIMNLAINASEAIREQGGVITISTGVTECSDEYLKKTYAPENLAPGRYLTLEVSDTGVGMDKATQGRIFEPFFTTKFTGRGLGLSAVLGIVRAHRGALRLRSELGEGTTFKIILPASDADAESLGGAPGTTESNWRGEGTILFVDDEQALRTLGATMLAALGFTVLAAADGREALSVYAEHRDEISLVLMDLTMPRMDGEEAFRGLRLIDPDVRVVLSSGYVENDLAARFAGKGLAGFVHKPYSLAELAKQMRAALEG